MNKSFHFESVVVLQIPAFIRLNSLYKMDYRWWSQMTGGHHVIAWLLAPVTWDLSSWFSCSFCIYLSVQLPCLVIVSTISILWPKLLILYSNTCEFQFFILTFKYFHDLWPAEPHFPSFCFLWLYTFHVLLLMPYWSMGGRSSTIPNHLHHHTLHCYKYSAPFCPFKC